MIKRAAIALLFTLCSHNVEAQTDTTWHIVVGNPFPEAYSTMTWSSNDTGFFLGSSLDITRTVDSGIDFSVLKFPRPIDTIPRDTNGHAFLAFSLTKAIQSVSEMSWPEQNIGFVAGSTYSDTFHTSHPTVLRTVDAGTTWTQFYPSDTTMQISHIFFARARVGYASGTLTDLSNFIAKTTDSGRTWSRIFHSDTLNIGKIYFRDANTGMFFTQSGSHNEVHIAYTTDGGTTFKFPSVGSDSTPNFLQWNDNGSWLAGIDRIYRSTDSGKQWTSVVPYDTLAGAASVAAFNGKHGFAFRSNEPIVLATSDYGVSWVSSKLPNVALDTVSPLEASMPSENVAYLLAAVQATTSNVLMKIKIPPPSFGGGGVAVLPSDSSAFSVSSEGAWMTFTTAPAAEVRQIDILDVLGRSRASLVLQPNATISRLTLSALRPGSYFARLISSTMGGAMVKFTVGN